MKTLVPKSKFKNTIKNLLETQQKHIEYIYSKSINKLEKST